MAVAVVNVSQRKRFVPHAYQRYCINRLLTDEVLALFLDLGLGKTVITLTAINDLKYNRFAINKALVVAPKKVAEATWTTEAEKWEHLKLLRVIPVLESEQKRIRALNTPADVYVINRENVPWLVEYYRNSWPFDMVVLDELSLFKNHQAKRFKALTWVRSHIKRIVGLTGTPAPNGLMDLWAQIYLLDRGERLEKYITHYREKYFEKNYNGFGYTPKPGAEEVIHQKIADICISMKAEDYLELPDCVTNIIPVVLDDRAKKLYRRMERDLLLEIGDAEITAASAAVLTGKLLQLCNGALYDDKRRVHEIHDCKIEAFLELIEQLNRKPTLVFYTYQHDLARLKKALVKTGLRVRELRTSQDQMDWNAGKIDVMLAHPASAAYGLNLQDGGNHVVWFGLTWSLELYQQANGRLYRQGQKQKVIIHHLVVQDGMDEEVMAALEQKSTTQDRLLESLKARIERVKHLDQVKVKTGNV